MAFISKSHPYLKVGPRPDLCDDPDIQSLEVSTPAITPFFIINIYNEKRDNQWTLERSFSQVNIPPRTILAGDFNAHHESWNPGMHPNQRTNHSQTRNLINRYSLDLANHPGTETRFGRKSKNKSVIDLTFSTPKLTNEIVNWCVDERSSTGPDQALIRFDIVSKDVFCEEISATARFNWKKADWFRFHEHLQENAKANDARWKTMTATPENE